MRYVIAETNEEFDRIFRDTAVIAEFADEPDEEEYVSADSALIEEIKRTSFRLLPKHEELVHHIEDWWPNHTRYVECSWSAFDLRMIRGLQALLSGRFEGWRIQIVVYENMYEGSSQIGSIVIASDWSLIDRALFDRAQLGSDDIE